MSYFSIMSVEKRLSDLIYTLIRIEISCSGQDEKLIINFMWPYFVNRTQIESNFG